jgi:hypothetical protein
MDDASTPEQLQPEQPPVQLQPEQQAVKKRRTESDAKTARACGRTRGELDGLKEKIKAKLLDYEDYFFKNEDAVKWENELRADIRGYIDRCKKFGFTIDELPRPIRLTATTVTAPCERHGEQRGWERPTR